MGSAQSVPAWAADCELVLQTGWTERELYNDNSLDFIRKLRVYLAMKNKAQEQWQRQAEFKARQGGMSPR